MFVKACNYCTNKITTRANRHCLDGSPTLEKNKSVQRFQARPLTWPAVNNSNYSARRWSLNGACFKWRHDTDTRGGFCQTCRKPPGWCPTLCSLRSQSLHLHLGKCDRQWRAGALQTLCGWHGSLHPIKSEYEIEAGKDAVDASIQLVHARHSRGFA